MKRKDERHTAEKERTRGDARLKATCSHAE